MAGEWELWLPIVLMVVLFIFLLLDIYARRAPPPLLTAVRRGGGRTAAVLPKNAAGGSPAASLPVAVSQPAGDLCCCWLTVALVGCAPVVLWSSCVRAQHRAAAPDGRSAARGRRAFARSRRALMPRPRLGCLPTEAEVDAEGRLLRSVDFYSRRDLNVISGLQCSGPWWPPHWSGGQHEGATVGTHQHGRSTIHSTA